MLPLVKKLRYSGHVLRSDTAGVYLEEFCFSNMPLAEDKHEP